MLNKSEYFDTLDLQKPECVLVKEWYRLLDGLWEDNCIVSPNSFIKICLQLVARNLGLFRLEQQSDSSEFMVLMIDCLHKGLARKVEIKMKTEGTKKIYKDAVENWVANHKNEYSEIVDFFYGQMVTYIKSKNKISHSFQPICYLTLEIIKKNLPFIIVLSFILEKKYWIMKTSIIIKTNSLQQKSQWNFGTCQAFNNSFKEI